MVTKSTHDGYKTELFAPVMKQAEGKYIAVLSDTSVDRDGERVGKSALNKIAENKDQYIAGLMDHDNKVLNQVAQWVNKRVEEIDGHHALVAEPQFFKSNPNAKIIKGMLDEGAKIGISIGAIVKNYEDQKFDNKTVRTFTELELLEASFVAIPSNRHGRAMAVAKSFTTKKEDKKMSEEIKYTEKDFEASIESKSKEIEADFNKKLEEKQSEVEELSKQVETLQKASDDKEEEDKKKEEDSKKALELEAEKTKDAKKVALEKQKFVESEVEADDNAEKKGYLPFVKFPKQE